MGLILTFITGLFFIVGILFNIFWKDNKKISDLSVSMAFIVVLNLIVFDIGPEVINGLTLYSIAFLLLGIGILKVLDALVPHHHHNHKERNDNIQEHSEHLEHISIVTLMALMLHNIIECMALYKISQTDLKSGVLMCIAIALHNLPLGFQIGSCIKENKLLYSLVLSFSGFVGGLIVCFIGNMPEILENYLLSFTLGMLLYLEIFELAKEFWKTKKNIYSLYGVIIGLIIIVITIIL